MSARENVLAHFGPLSYEEIGFLLSRMTSYVDRMGLIISIKKKLYAAMVESLENIYKHQDIIEGDNEHQPRFSLFYDGKDFSLYASNSIRNQKIDTLTQRLDMVNGLGKEGLRELYKQTILGGSVSPKGGAGLGIINIAKVTEHKISYTFERFDDQYSYYTLHVVVSVRPS